MKERIKAVMGKVNKTAVICALIHYLLGFFTDRFIFRYVVFDFSDTLQTLKSLETIGVKAIYLLLLLFLWQGIFAFVQKASARFRNLAIGYFLINMILLLFIWPGIWRMDEFGILSSATHLYPNFWQNYLTSVFYIYALMLIPFPAGVIICQAAVISLLASHTVCMALEHVERGQNRVGIIVENSPQKLPDNSEKTSIMSDGQLQKVGNKNAGFLSKWIPFLMIPFVMLPVLDSNMYPMRVSIWAFLEVTILSQSYFLYSKVNCCQKSEKGANSASQNAKRLTEEDKKLSDDFSTTSVLACGKTSMDLAVTCVIAAVVSVWRAEAIYYLIFFPVLLWLIAGKEKRIRFKKYFILYLTCFLVLFIPQKAGEKITSGFQYELTSMVLPLAELVRAADDTGSAEDAQLLSQIDRVINIETVLEGEGRSKNGIQLFWSEPKFQRQYTGEDFAACKAAYRQLILRYPGVFLRERVKTFLESSDLLMNTTQLYSDPDNANYREFATYPLSKPISEKLRTGVICFLEQRTQGDYDTKYPWADAVYSVILPLVLMSVLVIILACRKKWAECFVLLCSLIKVPLVFLTAPSRLFMYYYPVYLFGYCVVFYVAFRYLSAAKGQERVMK